MALVLTAWEIETYIGAVHHRFTQADKIGTDKCVFYTADGGEKVNMPVVAKRTSINAADGTDLSATDRGGTESGPELLVDDPLKDWQVIPYSKIEVRKDLQLQLKQIIDHLGL